MKRKNLILLTLAALLMVFALSGCGSRKESESSSNPNEIQSAGSTVNSSDSDVATSDSNGMLKVSFLDVGQGDSIFLELPDRRTMLIDAGNPEDASFIEDYIETAGYSRIDYLVATHPHDDHIGGMSELIKDFDIGLIYMPKASNNTPSFENLLNAIESRSYKINTAKAGVTILKDDNLKISILAPVKNSYQDLNNYSAVIKVVYGSISFLFMGDAEKLSEKQITDNVDSDVLKVGHHGSDYSSSLSFIKQVSPSCSVISVGKDNLYGHPASKTLKTLSSVDSEIFRTDLDGTIVIISDGTKITRDNGDLQNSTSESIGTSVTEVLIAKENSTIDAPAPGDTNTLVYITKSGSKYHRESCEYLSNSKMSISLSDAILGYEPCSKCDPPQ